jgi:UDP-galactopyranose mutase
MKYDYLIVGSGFFGSICARKLTDHGFKCLVIEKRNHIGGNCYTENRNGIDVHLYGPHIFHTSNEKIWNWINLYSEFNNFVLRPVANYKGEIYSLPFNMWTFSRMWNITSPEEAINIIKNQSSKIKIPINLEEQAIKLVGTDIYEKLIKGYTEKQWGRDPKLLPKEIIKRIPVRFTYDNNYFNDKYQGIPIGGYTKIFEKLLDGIEVKLKSDFFSDSSEWKRKAEKIIYTGPIDRYFDYKFGKLEYKTTDFEHCHLEIQNYQGTAMMNFTDIEIPYTRIIEHKHFDISSKGEGTWITREYPKEFISVEQEPYYPINDESNSLKYLMYKELSKMEPNVLFGGRLAEYKYYDMHQVIESALLFVENEIKK